MSTKTAIKNIFALDTVGNELSVAWISQGVMYSWQQQADRQGDILALALQQISAKTGGVWSDLDLIVVNIGPGGFTGLRVGIAALQAIALAHNIALWQLSSLQGTASQYYWYACYGECIDVWPVVNQAAKLITQSYYVLQDARMQELYAGIYGIENGIAQAQMPDRLYSYSQAAQTRALYPNSKQIGNGWSCINEADCEDEKHWTWAQAAVMSAYVSAQQSDLGLTAATAVRANYLRVQVAKKAR